MGEDFADAVLIDDRGEDGASAAAWAEEDIDQVGTSFILHLLQWMCRVARRMESLGVSKVYLAASRATRLCQSRCGP